MEIDDTVREAWDAHYAGGPPPWDVGRPQPAVVELADAGVFRGRILDAGCGTGENTLELASRGLDVLGVDVSSRAIAQAREKAAVRGIDAAFEEADALHLSALGETFDTVLDSALFHVFEDDPRARYVASLAEVMRPGGHLYLLCFSDLEPWGGGPRRVSEAELRQSFSDGWRVLSIEPARYETLWHDDGARAWLAHFERADASVAEV
jgi:SAM-dependent methyltransferase